MNHANAASDQDIARQEIERQLARLEIVQFVRRVALPAAAGGAVAGIFLSPVFPIVAITAAVATAAGEAYARSQRQRLDEKIAQYGEQYGANTADLSSAAHRLTIGGSAG